MTSVGESGLSSINKLILKRKLDDSASTGNEEAKRRLIESLVEGPAHKSEKKPVGSIPVTVQQLDEEDHPERKIPDIPENKRVRDYLRSQPLTGHGTAFGKAVKVVQCYRCKCYGHRAGDPECPYTETGDIQLELQRRIREDPLHCFKSMDSHSSSASSKVERMKQLLEEAKREEKERKHHGHHKHRHHHHHSVERSQKHYSSSSSSPS
ncbi:hypothetical protein WA556_007151, partial [Blastocystis sp. ATCC 50177/Nand II]